MTNLEKTIKRLENYKGIEKTYDKQTQKELEQAVLMQELKEAAYDELIPILCCIMEKYNGQNVGDRKKEKMQDNFTELTNGWHFYWESYTITIYQYKENFNGWKYDFKFYFDGKLWNEDGTFNALTQNRIEFVKKYNFKDNERPSGFEKSEAKRLLKHIKKIKEIDKKLQAAMDEYKQAKPSTVYSYYSFLKLNR